MNTNASSTILDKERDVDRVPCSITPKPAKTMKAAVVREFGKPRTIEEVPAPEVGPGQILVKIAATGVCHTDLHAADGDWPVKPTPPFIPGHEGVGHVVAKAKSRRPSPRNLSTTLTTFSRACIAARLRDELSSTSRIAG
jgi:hypothetical protein